MGLSYYGTASFFFDFFLCYIKNFYISLLYRFSTTYTKLNKLTIMTKKNLFEEYVTPEVEVISTVVEQGFSISLGIDDAEEDTYGDF